MKIGPGRSEFHMKLDFSDFLKKYIMWFILAALIVFFTFQAKNFWSFDNFINIVNQSAYLMIVGVGMVFIMLSGAIDLSVGYQISVLGVIMGLMLNNGVAILYVILAGLVIGIGMSLLNGVIYVVMKVFPFIITLATQYMFWGISFMLSSSNTLTGFPASFKVIGQGYFGPVPIAVVIMVVAVIFGSILLNRTYFGRYVYGLGSNPTAVSLDGVSVNKLNIIIYAMAGFFTALGSIVLIARTGSSASTMGPGMEFTILAGGMLGGIKMGGGGGKMSSMIVGLLILMVLTNGMQLMQLGIYPQYVAKGVVLIFAIGFDVFQTRAAIRRAKTVPSSRSDEDSDAPAAVKK